MKAPGHGFSFSYNAAVQTSLRAEGQQIVKILTKPPEQLNNV